MPMYFPDLESAQSCVKSMRHNKGAKRYNGIYPEEGDQLPEARKQLAHYFRDVWQDEIQAMEIELAVTEDDYEKKMRDAIICSFTRGRLNERY